MFRKLTFALASAFVGFVSAGAIEVPVAFTFDSDESLEGWTVINANNDSYQFVYDADKGGAFVDENRSAATNDYLISPAINVKAGSTYTVSVSVRNTTTYSSDKSKFEITAGTEPSTTVKSLYSNTTLSRSSSFSTFSGKYTATDDGDIYFGVHVYTASYNGGFVVASMSIVEEMALPGAVTDLTVTPGDEGEMAATLAWTWPEKDSFGGTKPGTKGGYVYRGTTESFAVSDDNKIATVDVDVTAYIDRTVTVSGKYYYKVIPYNDNGVSTVSVKGVGAWIGKDTQVTNPTNVVASLVEGRDDVVSLTFDEPTGSNGGWVDLSEITYNIARSLNGGTATVLETAWAGALPYLDETIPGPGVYQYTVKATYNGSTSFAGVKSNEIVVSVPVSVPYSEDFSSSNAGKFYTFIHTADCTRDWTHSTYSKCLDFYGGTAGTAYALTPRIKFEAGKAYELKFYVRCTGSDTRHVDVYLVDAPEVEAMTEPLMGVDITSTNSEKAVTLSVAEDGIYYIAFGTPGVSGYNDIYLDDISIVETVVTPMPVSDLKATVDADDCHTITVEWLNPTTTNSGEPIAILDKVVVESRLTSAKADEYKEIAVLTDIDVVADNAGHVAWQIETPGMYKFRITAFMGEMASEAVEIDCSEWAGYDVPANVAAVWVTVTDEGRLVEFEPVTKGVHGGVLESAVAYNVYRNDDVIAEGIETSSYLDDELDLPLGKYVYSVEVAGVEGAVATKATAIVCGDAMTLPIETSFDSADDFDLWTFSNNAAGNPSWSYSSSNKWVETWGNDAWAFTPKFHALQGTIRLQFKATCYRYNSPEELHIYLTTVAAAPTVETAAEGDDMSVATHTRIGVIPVTVANYPDTDELVADIPVEGDYHIGYHSPNTAMRLAIQQTDIEQHTTGVSAVVIDGNAHIVDGVYYPASAGVMSVYNIAGIKVGEYATEGEPVKFNLEHGVYLGQFKGAEGDVVTVKFAL